MNKREFYAVMKLYGDTQTSLAEAMGISRTRLNAKINETNNAVFTQPEISFIKARYKLTPERVDEIFFETKVS